MCMGRAVLQDVFGILDSRSILTVAGVRDLRAVHVRQQTVAATSRSEDDDRCHLSKSLRLVFSVDNVRCFHDNL